jgi:hypothetical protein
MRSRLDAGSWVFIALNIAGAIGHLFLSTFLWTTNSGYSAGYALIFWGEASGAVARV